jgi:C1A family cysteine protease
MRRITRSLISVAVCFAALHASQAIAQTPKPETVALPQIQSTLRALRSLAETQKWSFTPQVTEASARSLRSLAGENPPTPQQQINAPALREQATLIVNLFNEALEAQGVKIAPPACNVSAAQWDWRAYDKVTRPKFQQCGDCWAFASAGQIESAFLMAG